MTFLLNPFTMRQAAIALTGSTIQLDKYQAHYLTRVKNHTVADEDLYRDNHFVFKNKKT